MESVQITWPRLGGGAGKFYDETGTVRDVVQNHLFQVLCNLAMEPPVRSDSETLRDEKVKVLKSIETLKPEDVVRGQFDGYLAEAGVAPNSGTETFATLKLSLDSWRWQGVPFYIRAGKNLPQTATRCGAPASPRRCSRTASRRRTTRSASDRVEIAMGAQSSMRRRACRAVRGAARGAPEGARKRCVRAGAATRWGNESIFAPDYGGGVADRRSVLAAGTRFPLQAWPVGNCEAAVHAAGGWGDPAGNTTPRNEP